MALERATRAVTPGLVWTTVCPWSPRWTRTLCTCTGDLGGWSCGCDADDSSVGAGGSGMIGDAAVATAAAAAVVDDELGVEK